MEKSSTLSCEVPWKENNSVDSSGRLSNSLWGFGRQKPAKRKVEFFKLEGHFQNHVCPAFVRIGFSEDGDDLAIPLMISAI